MAPTPTLTPTPTRKRRLRKRRIRSRSKLPSGPTPTARKIRLPYRRDAEGRPLCRWCGVVVEPPRLWWCSDGCVGQYRERYDSAYQRKLVLARDHGICQGCGLDCVALAREVGRLYRVSGEEAAKQRLIESGLRPTDLRFKGRRKDRLRPLWDADHIVPVVEGGGGVGPDGLRTLCKECHRAVTRELMARRKKASRRKGSRRKD